MAAMHSHQAPRTHLVARAGQFEFNLGAKDYTDFQFAMVVPDFQCCELEIGLNCELILGVQNPDSG